VKKREKGDNEVQGARALFQIGETHDRTGKQGWGRGAFLKGGGEGPIRWAQIQEGKKGSFQQEKGGSTEDRERHETSSNRTSRINRPNAVKGNKGPGKREGMEIAREGEEELRTGRGGEKETLGRRKHGASWKDIGIFRPEAGTKKKSTEVGSTAPEGIRRGDHLGHKRKGNRNAPVTIWGRNGHR